MPAVFSLSFRWLLVTAVFAVTAIMALDTFAATIAEIRVDRLNLRKAPNRKGKPLGVLIRGERVTVRRRLSGWLEVASGDTVGYIRHRPRYLRLTESPSVAESQTPPKDAKAIQRRLADTRKQISEYSQKEADLVGGLDEMDKRLYAARRRKAVITDELKSIARQVAAVAAERRKLRDTIAVDQIHAGRRLAALYKLRRLGRVHVLASSDSITDFIRRQRALSTILNQDQQWLVKLQQDQEALVELEARYTRQQQAQSALEADLSRQLAAIQTERTGRSRLLKRIQRKKSMALAAVATLQAAAEALNRTMDEMNRAADVSDGQWHEVRRQDRKEGPFKGRKGLLNPPVDGKVMAPFGAYTNNRFGVQGFRSGIDIQARLGEPVRAVGSGRVLYASWFKGYGNMVIIDHGDHYYTVYAHVDELFKTKGNAVAVGDVIATVGDTGSMTGPKLYFEVRHHGKPLNPSRWLKRSG